MITQTDYTKLEQNIKPHLSKKGHNDAFLVKIASNVRCFESHGLCKAYEVRKSDKVAGVLCILGATATLSVFSRFDLDELCAFLLASGISVLETDRKTAKMVAKTLSLKRVDGDVLYVHKVPNTNATHNIYKTQDVEHFFSIARLANPNYKKVAFDGFYCDFHYRKILPAALYLLNDGENDIATAAVMYRHGDTAVLSDVAVLPERRRQGLASQIVSHACRDIIENEQKVVLFRTAKEAKGLYKKLGFKRERRFSLVIFS